MTNVLARYGLLMAVSLALPACQGGATPPPSAIAAAKLAIMPLTITTAAGQRHFRVEVARSPEEQAQGLMFRTALAPDAGMLFPFEQPRPAGFWMKNTVIPLDMLFIRADRTIARIAANTVPHSLAVVESGEPVIAVLELAGGQAAALGIAAGDRVNW
jgi:uncharacterized protein